MKWFTSILFFYSITVNAQDSTIQENKWTLTGYVKNMQSISFSNNIDQLLATNLLHNRINTKWKPTEWFTFAAEFRTRVIWGDEVRLIPNYAEQLRNSNENKNLSVTWLNQQPMVFHTNTERLWVAYQKNKWNVRAGRQRINWGITTVWNPNDIFNTYNFLDFDYEERPGSDAVKVIYNVSDFSNIEISYAAGNKTVKPVSAFKYDFNKAGYDIQLMAGIYENRFTIGAGWAGSIKEAGFKGEVQFYSGNASQRAHLNASLECDYVFKKGWYLNTGVLYNSEGLLTNVSSFDSLNFKFTPLNLMPTKWNFAITGSKEITPLFSGNATVLYAPGTNLFLFLPSFRYNIATNLDADLVWQSFFAETTHFKALNHRAFLRLKLSF